MIHELSIKNFAIIDDLKISFPEGLTILSGETGAGKSIIINALNLLLGTRASAKLIRTGCDSAEVEALFGITMDSPAARLMEEKGFDPTEDLLIKRIIAANGRHRNYINGSLATIQIINAITESLASISGQHAHQGLLKEEQHLLILDQFAGLVKMREDLAVLYNEIVPEIKRLQELKGLEGRRNDQIELLKFQKSEIEAARITPDEDKTLEEERNILRNSENLYQAVSSAVQGLYTEEKAAVETIGEVTKNLEKASKIDSSLAGKVKSLDEVRFIIEDVVRELQDHLHGINMDQGVLEEVENRLDVLNKLKKKYGGSSKDVSIEAVLERLDSIDKELSGIENLTHTIEKVEKNLKKDSDKLFNLANKLSKKRIESAKKISKLVEKELEFLKMGGTRFGVEISKIKSTGSDGPYLSRNGTAVTSEGIDRAAFMIAANQGEAMKPLADIASGGELSRVILALKAILAETDSLETVVFDEVDAGIGGGIAEMVGEKLSAIAGQRQIICITHLPQIAKFGDCHFRITKGVKDGRTRTEINRLNDDERVEEIARMLGGVKLTKTTLDHAREMLESEGQ